MVGGVLGEPGVQLLRVTGQPRHRPLDPGQLLARGARIRGRCRPRLGSRAGGEPRLLHTKRGAGYVLKD